jgi:hypothetical protein
VEGVRWQIRTDALNASSGLDQAVANWNSRVPDKPLTENFPLLPQVQAGFQALTKMDPRAGVGMDAPVNMRAAQVPEANQRYLLRHPEDKEYRAKIDEAFGPGVAAQITGR